MNRYSRPLTALALVGLMAACTSVADEAATDSPEATTTATATAPATETPQAASPEPSESASASAAASHDMGSMGGSGKTATVDIANFAYEQEDLTITTGTEVTFTNLDSAPHTVTAGTDADPMADVFDSGLLQQGESFTFVFEEPGEYVYFCDRHPPMVGTVTVKS
ncbi:MAG: plastocyanin/azurin family copper-binding protein [Candidatus Limnocylindria bacterium]